MNEELSVSLINLHVGSKPRHRGRGRVTRMQLATGITGGKHQRPRRTASGEARAASTQCPLAPVLPTSLGHSALFAILENL